MSSCQVEIPEPLRGLLLSPPITPREVWTRLSDTCPTPDLSLANVWSVKVTHSAVLGTSEPDVRNAARAILDATHAPGLKTHEWEEHRQYFELPGLYSRSGGVAQKAPPVKVVPITALRAPLG